MLSLLGGFVLAVLEFLLTATFSALTWLLRLLWPAWGIITIVGILALSGQSAEAGWFDWIWGSDTAPLERSTEIAQEAARVTSATTIAQAEQASAQAAHKMLVWLNCSATYRMNATILPDTSRPWLKCTPWIPKGPLRFRLRRQS